ncbi:unnamed protein product [Caenorhabditis brenneri]
MGGSNSKYFIFDDYPEHYLDVPRKDNYNVLHEKNWRIHVLHWHGRLTSFRIEPSSPFPAYRTYECVYQIIFINKYHLRRRMVIQGVEKIYGVEWYLSEKKIRNVHWQPNYNQFNFQAFVYVIIEDDGLRKLNLGDENVHGKSTTVFASGGSLKVPMQVIDKRAPLLAKYIDKKKPSPKLSSCSEEFFQVFHGVHVQLKKEEIKSLLKFSAKFQVLNVKRYCEQQLIRREDLEVSEKRKFKMACKFNLNILMNQLLREVKTVKKLAKLASIAVEMKSMDTNISKLLTAKMYQIF